MPCSAISMPTEAPGACACHLVREGAQVRPSLSWPADAGRAGRGPRGMCPLSGASSPSSPSPCPSPARAGSASSQRRVCARSLCTKQSPERRRRKKRITRRKNRHRDREFRDGGRGRESSVILCVAVAEIGPSPNLSWLKMHWDKERSVLQFFTMDSCVRSLCMVASDRHRPSVRFCTTIVPGSL